MCVLNVYDEAIDCMAEGRELSTTFHSSNLSPAAEHDQNSIPPKPMPGYVSAAFPEGPAEFPEAAFAIVESALEDAEPVEAESESHTPSSGETVLFDDEPVPVLDSSDPQAECFWGSSTLRVESEATQEEVASTELVQEEEPPRRERTKDSTPYPPDQYWPKLEVVTLSSAVEVDFTTEPTSEEVSFESPWVEVEEVASGECPCPDDELPENKKEQDESNMSCPYQAKHLSDANSLRQCDMCWMLVSSRIYQLIHTAR